MTRSVTIGVVAVGAAVATVIAWGLVEWAHVTADASCVVAAADKAVHGTSEVHACATSVPAAGRAFVAGLVAVVLGIGAAALPRLVGWTRQAPETGSPDAVPMLVGPPAVPAAPPSPPPALPIVDSGILERCIEVLDGPTIDDVTRQELERALAEAGCSPFDPTGGAFDRQVHRAVDRILTDDPATVGTVALTERRGWHHRGDLLRPADVVVHVAPER